MEDGDLRLPPDVAGKLNVKPGDDVQVSMESDGTLRVFPHALKPEDVCGMLRPYTQVSLTIEEMDEAIADAFRRGEL
jgi:antitoxin component of MazEF toxin-antitoxin module